MNNYTNNTNSNKVDFRTDNVFQSIPAVNEEDMSTVIGYNENGEDVRFSLRDISGTKVSGMAGSGKTRFLNLLVAAYGLSDNVEVNLIEGKSVYDYESVESLLKNNLQLTNNVDDLQEIESFLKETLLVIKDRMVKIKPLTKESNFWNSSVKIREENDLPLILLVIDETYDLFFKSNSGVSRAVKKVQESNQRLVEEIIKTGRSVGVSVIVSSQRLRDVPISILDNCAGDIAFRSSYRNESNSYDLDSSCISRLEAGTAIVLDANGDYQKVKTGYISEENLNIMVNKDKVIKGF